MRSAAASRPGWSAATTRPTPRGVAPPGRRSRWERSGRSTSGPGRRPWRGCTRLARTTVHRSRPAWTGRTRDEGGMTEPSPDVRSIDTMLREIETIPAVITDQAATLRGPLGELADELGNPLPEVILSGCGDPYFAGMAARLAMERDGGVRCQSIEALELARYAIRYVPVLPRPPLLVAVSHSDSVGRTIEAPATAAAFGGHTVALTGRADGRLAQVPRPVVMAVPAPGFSPGTSTDVAMGVALPTL